MPKDIITLNTKANIEEIAAGIQSGVERSYILHTRPKSKLDRLIQLAANIADTKKARCFIEVKFTYGLRAKRLDVISIYEDKIIVYKLSKTINMDKDALELDLVLTSIKNIMIGASYECTGCLVFDSMPSDKAVLSVKKILSNQVDFIQTIHIN